MKMPRHAPVMAPCPVCGRKPKDIWDINPCGGFVKLRCKPWFRKAHLEVECGAADPEYAYQKAVKAWNGKYGRLSMAKLPNPPKSKRLTKKVGLECLAILNEIDRVLFDSGALWRPDMWQTIGLAIGDKNVNKWLQELHDRIIDARANLWAWKDEESRKAKLRRAERDPEKAGFGRPGLPSGRRGNYSRTVRVI